QLRADCRAPQKWVQGRMKSMSGVDVAVRQEVLKGKGSIMFNVRDVLNTRKFRMGNELPTRFIRMANRWLPRTLMLPFSYRFGVQDLNKKNNQQEGGGVEEDMGGGF